jgi:hypothetical protein
MAIAKTFYYLRVLSITAPIVTMLINVIREMKIFLMFYMFVIYLFGLIFMVIGAGNHKVPGTFKDEYD